MAWAIIIAYATWPLYRRLRARLRRYPALAAMLMTLMLTAAIVLPALWMGMLLRTELGTAIGAVTAQIRQGSFALPDFVRGEDIIDVQEYLNIDGLDDLVLNGVFTGDGMQIDLGAANGGLAGVYLLTIVGLTDLAASDFVF